MSASPFDQVVNRHHTGSLKWSRYEGTEILPLWVADMDFASPPEVIDAIRRRVEHGVFGYARPPQTLPAAIVDYFRAQHHVEIDPEWLVWLPGCVPALSMACGSAGDAEDEVLTLVPVYPPFLEVHRDHKRRLTKVPLRWDQGRYSIPWDELDRAVTPKTRIFLFCNPHNPVGRVYSAEDVTRLAEWCAGHGLLLCSDEIHCDLVLEPKATPHHTAVGLPDALRANTITLMAASKTYNIAGLACAYAVIPDAGLRQRFRRSAGKMMPEISPLSFVATEAAYRYGEPWRQALLAYLRTSRDLLRECIAAWEPRVMMSPLEATYLAWLDVRGLQLEHPGKYFEHHGLGFSDGPAFGAPGFVRLNFGCPHSVLREALERLAAAVEACESA